MRSFCGLVALLLLTAPVASAPPDEPRNRLVVLLVFDQMRGDFLARWQDLFVSNGFRRLTGQGAWFQHCHYPYGYTLTGPGHATVATGCTPDVHGIIANEWFDRRSGKTAYCAGSDRYTQVPAPEPEKDQKAKVNGVAPDRLLAPTLADALKEQLGDRTRVVSLSLKDRSSVLPGGKRPDAVYWADKHGRFVTSTYYRDAVHDWVKAFNESKVVDRWHGKQWERLRANIDYNRRVGPDEFRGEGKGNNQGIVFPHPLDDGPKHQRTNYYASLANSPFGNEVLLELARKAIVAEKLGQRDAVDFLNLSFSSNDLIGHTWGPDSQEVLDVTLRSDLIVRDLLEFLDKQVGKGRYTVVLTADHGICPLPEVSRSKGLDARRVDLNKIVATAEEFLNKRFPGASEDPAAPVKKPKWITQQNGMIYLDAGIARRRGTTVEDAAQALAGWLKTQPGVGGAMTAADLAQAHPSNEYTHMVRRSYFAGRSGDVMLLPSKYYLLTSNLTGTTHGSPYGYDTHVPLVAYGPTITPGVRTERVSPQLAANILARAAGVQPPARASQKLPAGLFSR
ncbi:MAG: alkaline phosphatase family protein [Gemmataceae bacterium]